MYLRYIMFLPLYFGYQNTVFPVKRTYGYQTQAAAFDRHILTLLPSDWEKPHPNSRIRKSILLITSDRGQDRVNIGEINHVFYS